MFLRSEFVVPGVCRNPGKPGPRGFVFPGFWHTPGICFSGDLFFRPENLIPGKPNPPHRRSMGGERHVLNPVVWKLARCETVVGATLPCTTVSSPARTLRHLGRNNNVPHTGTNKSTGRNSRRSISLKLHW